MEQTNIIYKINCLINGNSPITYENIEQTFPTLEDCNDIINWANTNPNLLSDKRIAAFVDQVFEIKADRIYGDDPVLFQANAIGGFLVNTFYFVQRLIFGKADQPDIGHEPHIEPSKNEHMLPQNGSSHQDLRPADITPAPPEAVEAQLSQIEEGPQDLRPADITPVPVEVKEFSLAVRKNKIHFTSQNFESDLQNLDLAYRANLLTLDEVQSTLTKGMKCWIYELIPQRLFEAGNALSADLGTQFALATVPYRFLTPHLHLFLPLLEKLSPDQRYAILMSRGPKDYRNQRQAAFEGLSKATMRFSHDIASRLVQEGLNIGSEEYLQFSSEEYARRVSKLREIVHESTLTLDAKKELSNLIDENERWDERLLLQYASPQELERISNAHTSPIVAEVVASIQKGEWNTLLQKHGRNADLTCVFLAAYQQKQISISELTTAMTFHRAFFHAPEAVTIFPLSENDEALTKNLKPHDASLLRSAVQKVNANEKFAMSIRTDSLDENAKNVLMTNHFTKVRIPGVFQDTEETFALVSYGIAKQVYPQLSPVLGLTPSTKIMAKHVFYGLSDYAVFMPEATPVIHGAGCKGGIAPSHDLFHSYSRQQMAESTLSSIMQVIDNVYAHFSGTPYENKLSDGMGHTYPLFTQKPNIEELTSYWVDRLCGEFVDGAVGNGKVPMRQLFHNTFEQVNKTDRAERYFFEPVSSDELNAQAFQNACSILLSGLPSTPLSAAIH